MKKFFMFLLGIMLMFGMASCDPKNSKKNLEAVDTTEVVEDSIAALNVEHLVAMDRQDMYLNHNKDYRWYETCIDLVDFMYEDCDGTIAGVANVFQAVEDYGDGSFDTYVVLFAHANNGNNSKEIKHGFWVEDFPMNDDEIKVTFEEAFQKINEVNLPKPHSKHCVLRKQIGPKACNPQYIFGNTHAQIYVDAVTGAVSKDNPAFGGLNLGCPLGEWP